MRYDWYGTCPKCKHMGWCDYKGKAHIHKDGPGSDTYKVLIYKCKNCGRKFGFSSLAATFQNQDLNNEEEDNGEEDWKQVYSILNNYIKYHCDTAFTPPELYCALDITEKHCGCDS